MQKNKKTVITISFTALFSALTVICSWISIPSSIPFTLQTFAIVLGAMILTMRDSLLSVIVYILLGTAGLPVFSGFKGGISVIAGPTGGYIYGFILTSIVCSLILMHMKKTFVSYIISGIAGTLCCYICGTLHFGLLWSNSAFPENLVSALMICVVPYIVPDLIKIVLASFICCRIKDTKALLIYKQSVTHKEKPN